MNGRVTLQYEGSSRCDNCSRKESCNQTVDDIKYPCWISGEIYVSCEDPRW